MTYYTIDIKDSFFTPHVTCIADMLDLKDANRNITTILWLITGVEVDPDDENFLYHHHTPVLVFLN